MKKRTDKEEKYENEEMLQIFTLLLITAADLLTSQITKVYFATPKSVFFTQKVYFTSKSQKDAHYLTFKHKNKYN